MSETPLGRRKSSDDGVARSKGALENRRLKAERIILPGEARAAVRASASLDGKNCLIHALTRIYVHFFTSILYVNFQFGLNEYSDYLALLLPSSYGEHSPYKFLKIAPLPSRYVTNA